MKRWKRSAALVLVLTMLVTLLNTAQAAGNIYLTAVNENLLELTSDTMPTWSNGVLYVPYTVFDGSYTGINLGISSSYSRDEGTVTLYTLQQMVVFDLNRGTCYNPLTEQTLSGRAILRNGRPYVPVASVCSFFGLSYSVIDIDEGYIVRIKGSGVVLSDYSFVDSAQNSIRNRIRDYNQANQSQPTPGVLPPTYNPEEPDTEITVPDDPVDTDIIPTYLAFSCEDSQGLSEILDTLDSRNQRAIFFFDAQGLERQDDLIFRILGSGYSIGLIAQGRSTSATNRLLEEANQTLSQVAYTRTSVVLVPESQREELEAEGWICWDETASAVPTQGVGTNTYANQVIKRISGNHTRVYLTLDASSETARVLPTLLRRLAEEGYGVSVPLETRL
ncbi:hypothetical protein QUW63_07400 [Pseudoflavonifractor phocaeensis]|uniref:hypothetical protein n=1 Tax=Pseudoflavonifractor phocaeensis TaxID=1870988 RepID=UPI0025A42B05|nr:hypothetical protein [Pseudoflavonifractor phocaeensis]MDM8238928.1 hypothetical protein [Pseudoflavonifractor phocaeensis]